MMILNGTGLSWKVADIVRRAIEAPLRRIAQNAGVEGSVVQKVKARGPCEGRRHRPDERG